MKEYLSSSLGELNRRPFVPYKVKARESTTLSPREQEVLFLTALALSDREISIKLKVTPDTVKAHSTRIKNKLGLSNRVEMALYVYRNGLLPEADKILEGVSYGYSCRPL